MGRPHTHPPPPPCIKRRRPKWAPYCPGGQTILNVQGNEAVVTRWGCPTLLGRHLAGCYACEVLRAKWAGYWIVENRGSAK
jgi:hypothetical protein